MGGTRNRSAYSWRLAALAAAWLLPFTALAETPVAPLGPNIQADRAWAPDAGGRDRRSAEANPLVAALEQGLADYRERWGSLPSVTVPSGATLRPGAAGPRVQALRARLGLAEEGIFDAELETALRDYRAAHGLGAGAIADAATIASLNRGPASYERIIETNIARARALPAELGRRFILVDTAAARLWMYEDGRPVDSMRVIVGRPTDQTPTIASSVQYAVLNPYWNVPDDLVRRRIAPNVLQHGLAYLRQKGYELLSDYGDDAQPVDPATVDWAEVAAGRRELRVRQLPGAANMMGALKFMFPNSNGIYLHDTPERQLFAGEDRRQSSGCIRLEDAPRLGEWLFGRRLATASTEPEVRVDLPQPVPVYVTYQTVVPGEQGLVFRSDVYGRDGTELAALTH